MSDKIMWAFRVGAEHRRALRILSLALQMPKTTVIERLLDRELAKAGLAEGPGK